MRIGLMIFATCSVLAVGTKAQQAMPARPKPVIKRLDAAQVFSRLDVTDPQIIGYDTTIRKRNIVWAEDEIRITEPLRSFGGQIVLIANRLVIDAPIDSRPYIRHSKTRPYQPGFDDGNPGSKTFTDVYEQIKNDTVYLAMFQDYYAHCYDCFVDTDKETYIPELPSGITPNTYPFWKSNLIPDATAPADEATDFLVLQSGDIYIYAHEIIVNPNLLAPIYPTLQQERAECKGQSVRVVPYAINAGGPRGGRGGAGMSSPCVDVKGLNSGYDQGCFKIDGGLSGPGGRGGDGGTVYIRLVNYDGDDMSQVWRTTVNTRGGAPGDQTKVRTPSQYTMNRPGHPAGNRCAFVEQGVYPPASPGKDGSLHVESIDTNRALQDAGTLLNKLDSRADYDYKEVAERALLDPSVTSLSFSDALTKFLVESLLISETALVQDADEHFFRRGRTTDPYLPPFFRNLSMNGLIDSDLSNTQLSFARELTVFESKEGSDPFQKYFEKTGGLFNVYDAGSFDRYLSQGIRVDVATGNKFLGETVRRLDRVQEQIFEQLAYEQKRDMQQKISAIQEKLAAALAKAKQAQAAGSLAWLGSLIGELTGAGNAVKLVISALGAQLDAAQQDTIFVDKGLGSALSQADDAFRKLTESLTYHPTRSDLTDLLNELQAAEEDYKQLIQTIEATKNKLFQQEYSDFLQLLNLRYFLDNKIAANSALFHDLFRSAIVGYLNDPARDEVTLRNNLNGLVVFLNSFPTDEPYLRLVRFSKECGDPLLHNCFTVQRSNKWQIVTGLVRIGGLDHALPLYVIGPHRLPLTLPSYGANLGSRWLVSVPTPQDNSLNRPMILKPISSVYGWTIVPRKISSERLVPSKEVDQQ